MSSPDSLYNNPYWNCRDKEKYKSYDLLRSEGYLELYGLAKYGELKNLVLSIKPLNDDYYDIHSMYYWGHFSELMNSKYAESTLWASKVNAYYQAIMES